MYRQGDVLLVRVDAIPADARPQPRENGRVVLARGEVAGHAHAIAANGVTAFAWAFTGEPAFIEVSAETVLLEHEEHATVVVPFGRYRVVRQREYESSRGFPSSVYVSD